MLFNSLTFLLFLAVVLGLHSLPLSWRTRKINLLVASYLFYAAWNPPFVVLLWISTGVDWFVGGRLAAERGPFRRRALLMLSLATNLGLLGFFKYGGFLLDTFVAGAALIGVHYRPPAPDIVLPIGISFYTFQTLAYTIDIYRRRAHPCGSLLDFALFVTFFPQLVAGPIVRPDHLLPQFARPRRASADQLSWGLALLTLGLFEKIVVADTLLAPAADAVFGAPGGLTPAALDAWAGTLAFSGQIFADFAGYSTCAIGVALMLGFSLPDNFRFPYAAIGFRDFWRRWHISLSTWLRDYLYIPLGGNRRGPRRTAVHLAVTMLLGGLWHGAAWTFVAWGALHGLFLAVERRLQPLLAGDRRLTRFETIGLGLMTYGLVSVAWVFFRAPDFPTAGRMLSAMVSPGPVTPGVRILPGIDLVVVAVVTIAMLLIHAAMRHTTLEGVVAERPWWQAGAVWAGLAITLLLVQRTGDAFIYFQF